MVTTGDNVSGTPWHAMQEGEVYDTLVSSPEGLTEDAAVAIRGRVGPNVLPTSPPPTIPMLFIRQFFSPLIYVLLAAGIVSIGIGEETDAIFIFVVIMLNALIGTYQEWRAEQSVATLKDLLTIKARVRRNGVMHTVSAEELVPGDVVAVESGAKVPADLRITESRSLSVDESFLTGESSVVEKQEGVLPAGAPVSERRNMLFAGSTIARGRALGVVVATGVQTEIGLIAETVATAATSKPPLIIRMEAFSKNISVLVLGACGLLGLIALGGGMSLTEVFFVAVALAVSAIPEGLPVALAVVLSVATGRMSNRNVIVRRLAAVESLGSCTVIASDKTGTLTVNEQTAKLIVLPCGTKAHVSGQGYDGEGHITDEEGQPPRGSLTDAIERIVNAGVLCNDATLERDGDTWVHTGDEVDVALLALAYKAGTNPSSLRRETSFLGTIPFESEYRYAATFYQSDDGARTIAKGAFETVSSFCTEMMGCEGIVPLDANLIAELTDDLSSQGYRVLAIAEGRIEEMPASPSHEHIPPLVLLGLVAFIDPLRPEAKAAVNECFKAGIDVVMVTGDHPATAFGIAKELGIATAQDDVITGGELDTLGTSDDGAFISAVRTHHVFSRVTPIQKLHIIDAFVKLGEFVAVTGDGVNDAPALRRANIGIAMGSGTDVAKDTASMIVTDDNFASIVAGVEEGRFAYDNVRKVIFLLVSTGAAEITLFAFALMTGLPLPLFAIQLLWLNLVTNGIQHMALSVEAGEEDAMIRPPRSPQEAIFNRLMKQQVVVAGITMGLAAYAAWYAMLTWGWNEGEARNILLLLMVLLENVHVFNCRSERHSTFRVPLSRNYALLVAVVGAQGLHIGAMYVPVMQGVLSIAPVTLAQWGASVAAALSVLATVEIFKWLRNRKE